MASVRPSPPSVGASSSAERVEPARLIDDLRDARAHLLAMVNDLDDRQWLGPRMPTVNPILWEVGHAAWFQEKWILRHRGGRPPIREDGDALWDSAKVAHDTRWNLPLPTRAETLAYAEEVLERSVDAARAIDGTDRDEYFFRLATAHEDMHGEALTYTRQTLAWPPPPLPVNSVGASVGDAGPVPGDVEISGGRFVLGAGQDAPFVFDNEKWAHEVDVAPFALARAAVTNAEFAAFLDADGYRRRELWSLEGWTWREQTGASSPAYWTPDGRGGWLERRFNRDVPLAPHHAVIHVCWYEAEAYCRFVDRRLPTEAEWELAAGGVEKRRWPWGEDPPSNAHANLDARVLGSLDVGAFPAGDTPEGCRQMFGNVWEWTASDFRPYPGFVIDPYAEYSAPWFSTPDAPHKVLRGGCWATRSRLLRTTWRNFYPPDRRDVLAGFRTCRR